MVEDHEIEKQVANLSCRATENKKDIQWIKTLAYLTLSAIGGLVVLANPKLEKVHEDIDEIKMRVAKLEAADRENKMVNDLFLGRLKTGDLKINDKARDKYRQIAQAHHANAANCHPGTVQPGK